MFSGAKETISKLAEKVTALYEELVKTNVQFEEVRKYTKENIDEFKRLLERLNDKLDEAEKDRIRRETELLGKIKALEARLSALSEQAFHAVAKEAAMSVVEKMIAEKQLDNLNPQNQSSNRQLPKNSES